MPKHGDLRVWWIPQVPGKRFLVEVRSLREAKLIMDTLALYDAFQFANNIKPDYSNVGGLMVFDDCENDEADAQRECWTSWLDREGREFEDLDESEIESAIWEGAQAPEENPS